MLDAPDDQHSGAKQTGRGRGALSGDSPWSGGSSCLNGYSQPLTESCWLLVNQARDQIEQKSSHNQQLTLNS